MVFGRNKYAKYLCWKGNTTERALERLEKTYNLVSNQKSHNFTIVTVHNYDALVEMSNQVDKRWASNGQAMGTSKSIKTVKTVKTEDVPASPESIKKTYKAEITSLIGYLSEKLGVKFPNYGKQGRAVKSMLDSGYSVDDIRWAIDTMISDSWWKDHSFDMKNVADQIPILFTRTVKEKKQ